MRYYKFSSPLFPMDYQFSTGNDITKEEVIKWFKETYNFSLFEVEEVTKEDIDKIWVIHLFKEDGKIKC